MGASRAVVVGFLAAIGCAVASGAAHAGNAPSPTVSDTANDIDGVYLMLGPLGGLSYRDRAAQSVFGVQLLAARVRERARLSTVGLALGGMRHSVEDSGRVSADVLVGTHLMGIHLGLAVGPHLEIARVGTPRWGTHATVWVFAGVVPYIKVGWTQERARFLEMGLQLMLPAWRK